VLRRVGRWQWAGRFQQRFVQSASQWLRHQDVTIQHGLGAGLRFNAGGANPGYALGTSEPIVQDVLGQLLRPGQVVWDVGANVGFYTVIAAHAVGPTGQVVAFEPLPSNVDALRHNLALNGFARVTVVPCAAAAASGDLTLTLGDEPTWAHTGGPADAPGAITVPALSLDDAAQRHALADPDLVKIDVEGAECDVIAGMRGIIARHPPVILCEMHGKNATFVAALTAHGYRMRALESDLPVERAPWDVHVLAEPASREVA
jgi:FkbM family methyltransferase